MLLVLRVENNLFEILVSALRFIAFHVINTSQKRPVRARAEVIYVKNVEAFQLRFAV